MLKKISELNRSTFTWSIADKTVRTRIIIITLAFAAGFFFLSFRVVQVASSDLSSHKNFAHRMSDARYDIVDRNGNLLAVNVPSASLFANPLKVIDPQQAVQKLQKVFPKIDKTKILRELKSKKPFIWIKRDITPRQQQEIFNLGMPGFEFENEQKRIYTYGNLLSHVIGYVGRDMTGLAGIEKYYDEYLSGQNDFSIKLSDIDDHKRLKLSVDIRLQNILNEEMSKTIKKFDAKGGAGIIVDALNGEILAMVSKPDFDPHYPTHSKANCLFNIATQGVYEMGSGMKALTMAIGFDTSTITMQDAYDLTYMKVNGFQIRDYHPQKGWSSVAEIFLKSSNVGVSQIMLEIGRKNLRKYLKQLRLLDKLELELPELGRPLFQPYTRWTDLGLVTMSYGYGISESPAHFIQSMIPVVNGGILYPLTLLKRQDGATLEGQRIFKESTSDNMRKLMRLVVKEGTGKKAAVKGYFVGGKTGTANKAVNGKYDKNKRISSFFAILPATDPKYLIYIVFDEPKGIKETYNFAGGGWTAAPTVGAVLKRLAILYGLSKVDENSSEAFQLNNVIFKINNEV